MMGPQAKDIRTFMERTAASSIVQAHLPVETRRAQFEAQRALIPLPPDVQVEAITAGSVAAEWVHIPLTKKLPGLRRYTIGRHATAIRGGEPYYWIAELEWDKMDALQQAFQSPEGQATSQDIANLASNAGVRSMVYEVEEV